MTSTIASLIGSLRINSLLQATGGWVAAIKKLAALRQNERPTKIEPAKLAMQLQRPEGQKDPFADIVAIPEAIKVLDALVIAEELRRNDERVDVAFVKEAGEGIRNDLVERVLDWGELVGIVSLSDHGFVLNPLLKAALQRLRES